MPIPLSDLFLRSEIQPVLDPHAHHPKMQHKAMHHLLCQVSNEGFSNHRDVTFRAINFDIIYPRSMQFKLLSSKTACSPDNFISENKGKPRLMQFHIGERYPINFLSICASACSFMISTNLFWRFKKEINI